ncbi:MAG: disulfide bond formation protein B [Betaproteobacteria bacterium]
MSYARLIRPRTLFAAIFLGTSGLLAYGLWLQHASHLEPCPMCILQRYAFVVAGLVGLVAAVHNPRALGVRIYGGLVILAAIAGGGVATRQTWLQHNPPQIADCGPGLEFMVESFPLSEALPMIFRGSGDCSKVDWTFLGFSIAEWALACFVGIALISALAMIRVRASAR